MNQRPRISIPHLAVMVAFSSLAGSCTPTAWLNNFSTRRGTITIGFVNNTPFRANFTFGGYDTFDRNTVPVFSQLRIEGNTAAAQQTQQCRRVFSLGGAELERLIEFNDLNVNDMPVLHEDVYFSSAPANDPLAAEPTEGFAVQQVRLDGIDYVCGGLLLFVFVQDPAAPGGFRIDYTFFNPT
ncbi:MAG: hypothetical protein L6Q92_03025 [Phycisphaerae bacterium]|nr:hypothetical protein [Phycisphaerae bacterium]